MNPRTRIASLSLFAFMLLACTFVTTRSADAQIGRARFNASAKWTLESKTVSVQPGKTISLKVSARLLKGWHIYSSKKFDQKQAPIPTQFFIKPTSEFELSGPVTYPKPISKMDPGFKIMVELLDGTPTFNIPLKARTDTKPGTYDVTLTVLSQTCNDRTCLMPQRIKMPLRITVLKASDKKSKASEEPPQKALPETPDAQAAKGAANAALFLSYKTFKSGDRITGALRVTIKPEWHIYSNKPKEKNLIATTLTTGKGSSFELKNVSFPKPVILPPGQGNLTALSVYEHTIWISFEMVGPDSLDAGPHPLHLQFRFQACKESLCALPVKLSLKTVLTLDPTLSGVTKIRHAAIFKKLESRDTEIKLDDGEQTPDKSDRPPATENATQVIDNQNPESSRSIYMWMFLGLLGGLILNVMPCVLPVLSLKIFGLVQQSKESRREILLHGLMYSFGVWVCFMAFGTTIVILKHGAHQIGWGIQFQQPLFVALLSVMIFGLGLSMLGVFEIPAMGLTQMDRAASKTTKGGSFMHGLFATLLATPCTAPLLAPALGFAFSQSDLIIFGMFNAVALGMAFPFLILGIFPAWTSYMPKPGAWMMTFKEVMGFLLLGTVVFLLNTLIRQIDEGSMIRFFSYLCLTGIGAWILGKWAHPVAETKTKRIAITGALALLIIPALWLLNFNPKVQAGANQPTIIQGIKWHPFSLQFIKEQSKAGRPVFVDATAEWCTNCKFYESTVIYTDEIATLMKEKNYVAVKADYTNANPAISKWLEEHNRRGVPLYVIVPAHQYDKKFALPDLLTKSNMREGLIRGASGIKSGE